jgi:hypothetical protein
LFIFIPPAFSTHLLSPSFFNKIKNPKAGHAKQKKPAKAGPALPPPLFFGAKREIKTKCWGGLALQSIGARSALGVFFKVNPF